MEQDECLSLKYQMIDMAGIFNKNLNRMKNEWTYSTDMLNQMLINNFFDEEFEIHKS